jgi:hypothetical protein
LATLGVAFAALAGAAPVAAVEYRDRSVYATVTGTGIVLGNELVERRWSRLPFQTTALVDKRDGGRAWAETRRDFALTIAGADLGSEAFKAESAQVEKLPGGGLRVTIEAVFPPLGLGPQIRVTRVVEAYPGIAGFRVQSTLRSNAPLVLTGVTLDEVATGPAQPTAHAFRAGADWREPDWPGPPLAFGNPNAGTWRDTRSAPLGAPLEAAAQWLSLSAGGRSLFMVAERADLPSTRAEYAAGVARLAARYPRDGVLLGPFEEQAHVEGLSSTFGRQRVVEPLQPVALEAAFTGLGTGDGDEEWQHHRYLLRRAHYPHAVTFNSNGTDDNVISTGAKDDMDFATVQKVAPLARRLGVEIFILDDGWQAISGDWNPDSPQYREPRGTPPRFPDAEFRAVRHAIAPMRLGLWMSPMSFNPQAQAFEQNPQWACLPVGVATALVNALDPDSGSNEAGIGLWSTAAIPHVESRIRRAIEQWGVQYFKFDFLVWLDCVGNGDIYAYKDAFVAMLDRLRRDHPRVTFQIDETNDYRLFPFESIVRGPSWFQNGTPQPHRLLHNLWNLSPWVPSYSLGQHFLGGRQWEDYPVDTLMAVALLSHLTFFSDLRDVPAAVIDQAAPWIAFYKRYRSLLAGVVYPLLADPLERDWTALQSWDPDHGQGALLAFRQDSPDATRRIALRNVPPGMTFTLRSAPQGTAVGTATSAELSAGIDVTIPTADGASVLLISP